MAANDTGSDRNLRSGRRIPYVLLIPGMLFTFVFFIVPLITLLQISLSTKPNRLLPNYEFTWEWSNFTTAFEDFGEQLLRSFVYAGIATLLCLLIAYPVAYFIAFKGGRWRNVLLGHGDGAVLHQLPVAHDRLAVAAQRQRAGDRGHRGAAASTGSSRRSASSTTAGS